jgi:hypothetical protein
MISILTTIFLQKNYNKSVASRAAAMPWLEVWGWDKGYVYFSPTSHMAHECECSRLANHTLMPTEPSLKTEDCDPDSRCNKVATQHFKKIYIYKQGGGRSIQASWWLPQ